MNTKSIVIFGFLLVAACAIGAAADDKAEDDFQISEELDEDEDVSWKGLVDDFEQEVAKQEKGEDTVTKEEEEKGWFQAPKPMRDFMFWTEKHEIDTNLVAGSQNGKTYTVAKSDMQENDRFVRIPSDIMITKPVVDDSAVGRALVEAGIKLSGPNAFESYLALFVMVEMKSTNSKWKEWFAVVPSPSTPFFWSRKVLNEARGSLQKAINADVKATKSMYDRFFPRLATSHPKIFAGKYSISDYTWAVAFVRSRMREVPVLKDARRQDVEYHKALIPLIDLMEHDTKDYGMVPVGVDGPSFGIVYFGNKVKSRDRIKMSKAKDKTSVEWILNFGEMPEGANPADHVIINVPKASAAAKQRLKKRGLPRSWKLRFGEAFPETLIEAFQIVLAEGDSNEAPRSLALTKIKKLLNTRLAGFDNTIQEDEELLNVITKSLASGMVMNEEPGADLMRDDPSPGYILVVRHRISEQKTLRAALDYVKAQSHLAGQGEAETDKEEL